MILIISLECSKVHKNCRGYASEEEKKKYTDEDSGRTRGRSSLGDYSIGRARKCCGDLICRKFQYFSPNPFPCKMCHKLGKKDCSKACFKYVCNKQ